MKFVNMTPHNIVVCGKTYKSKGVVRCELHERVMAVYKGIKINHRYYGSLEGLPEEKKGTMYIVSDEVAQAALEAGRRDILVPDECVKDSDGNVIKYDALRTFC